MKLLPISRKCILFIAVLIALGIVTPVLADYLGPNRTETTTISVCHMVKYECKEVNGHWQYKRTEDWSCPTGHDACEAGGGSCNASDHTGSYCAREEGPEEVIVTHPPATITGTIENCTERNGWCITPTNLALTAREPLFPSRGKVILLIEGRLNGVTFAIPNDEPPGEWLVRSVGLQEGQNDFEYWALSSWGDSSEKGYSSAKVDTVPPDVGLDISGVSGTNGWYVSDTTVTAAGADATSGVASMLLTIDGGANWQPTRVLEEGVYTVTVSVTDNAGHESHSSTPVAVDTTTPSISMSVSGTPGNYGWYKSNIQVTAISTDATSGIATFDVSADGGAYQAYTPIAFSDGPHTLRFKAVDNAGNLTETPLQEFYVDTIPPVVDLPGSWPLGRDVSYDARDAGSGLLALRIVIEDENEKYAKVAMDRDASGASYSSHLDWNGEFRDQTVAPPGTYLVWIKASDRAGHEHFELGRVIVPQPNVLFNLLPTEEPIVSADPPLPPAELSETGGEPPASVPPVFDFGGGTTESTGTTESSTQTVLLSTGTGPAASTSSPGILWGGAAAAAIAAATAYALEETRKRKEAEEAQAAAVRAEIAKDKAERAEKGLTKEEKKALKAEQAQVHDEKVQERKEREEWANPAKEKALLKAQEERDRAYQEQLQQEKLRLQQLQNSTPPGIPLHAQPVNLHGDTAAPPASNQRIVDKMTKFEREEEKKWEAAQVALKAKEEEKPADNWWTKLTGYFGSEKQGSGKVVAAPALGEGPEDEPDSYWKHLGDVIAKPFISIGESLSKAWEDISESASKHWEQVKKDLSPVPGLVAQQYRDKWESIKADASQLGQQIGDSLKQTWNDNVVKHAKHAGEIIDNSIKQLETYFTQNGPKIADSFKKFGNDFVVEPLKHIGETIGAPLQSVSESIDRSDRLAREQRKKLEVYNLHQSSGTPWHVPTDQLKWDPALPALSSLIQNQFIKDQNGQFLLPTANVECVTTSAVDVRNMVNYYLANLTGKQPMPLLLLQDYVKQTDSDPLPIIPARFPTGSNPFDPWGKIGPIDKEGMMHPGVQLPIALNQFRQEFDDYYGCSFQVEQSSYNSPDDIGNELRQGHYVIVSGMYPPDPNLPGQVWLGGSPHSMGAVVDINGSTLPNKIKIMDTNGTFYDEDVSDFLQWWGRESTGNLYAPPNSMTVIIPDAVCPAVNTPTNTPASSPTSTPASTQTPAPASSQTGTPTNTPASSATSTPSATQTNTPAATPTGTPTP